jgi:hypothetical protein
MDFSGYQALSGRKDWASIRSDRLMELSLMKQQQQDLDNQIQQQSQAQNALDTYMSNLQQVSVLEQDQEKLNNVEKQARQSIIEGLKKSGNDVRKFMLSGGGAILKDYTMQVITSDEMKNAMNNKLAWGQYVLNKANGLQDRPMAEGNIEEQLQKLTNGEIDRLKYNGAAKPVAFNTSLITSMYGKNPYRRQSASRDDIYKSALSQGMEDFQAEKYANDYERLVSEGSTPLYYNYKTDNGAAVLTKGLKRLLDSASGGDSDLLSQYLGGVYSDKDKNKTTTWSSRDRNLIGSPKDFGSAAGEAGAGKQVTLSYSPLSDKTFKLLSGMADLRWDNGSKSYFYLGNGIIESNGKEIDLKDYDIPNSSILDYVTASDGDNSTKGYLRVNLKVPLYDIMTKDELYNAESKQGHIKNTKEDVSVLIPVNTNNFEKSTHRFTTTQEKRGSELNMDDLQYMNEAEQILQDGN